MSSFVPYWLAVAIGLPALAWTVAVALLALVQRRFIYRPPPAPSAPRPDWMRDVLTGPIRLGWWCPPATPSAPVLIFFHGNCGTLARIAQKLEPLRQLGVGFFAATYRGYEGNPGWPDEQGLYADGRAVQAWLAALGIGPERTILYGESLGTGVAVQLAGERPVKGLILESPYASIAAIARRRYPWAPSRLLVRDRFDNAAKIGRLALPILILHGTADRTVPFENAQQLKGLAPTARLAAIAGAGHTDLFEKGADEHVAAFLKAL